MPRDPLALWLTVVGVGVFFVVAFAGAEFVLKALVRCWP